MIDPKLLDDALERAYEDLALYKVGTPERKAALDEIDTLQKLKNDIDKLDIDEHDKEVRRGEESEKNERELELKARELKSQKVGNIIGWIFRIVEGAAAGFGYILILDWEKDNSMRSKAWPFISDKILKKKL